MSTPETNSDGKAQDLLPDLYRLLGLEPLEADIATLQRGLSSMQKKADAAEKSDPKLAQRAARIVALGKKNLLDAERKSAYDRAWMKTYGATLQAVPTTKKPAQPEVTSPAPALVSTTEASPAKPQETELEWDLEALESMLPAEDPRAPFDLGGFLRYSASLPESNPAADYEKLQGFLGGATTVTMAAPPSISAAELLPEYSLNAATSETEDATELAEIPERFLAPKKAGFAAPLTATAPGGIAKQIRRKRTRAMLISVGSIAGACLLLFGGLFYFITRNSDSKAESAVLAQSPLTTSKPQANSGSATLPLDATGVKPAVSSGLPKVGGIDGNAASEKSNPNMMEGIVADALSPQPPTPSPETPAVPNEPSSAPTPVVPTTTAASNTVPPPATSMATTEPIPETQPTPPPADAVLTPAEKAAWNRAMKETLKTLGLQNFKVAKEQLSASESLAKTQVQRDQLKRLAAVAKLVEEYHGFLIDAIASLGPAETFKIGGSSEASFIEGTETAVSLKIRGRATTFALTELQIGVANGLVDLKMDMEHPTSLARKAAFALVHPKTNGLALKAAREQLAMAAAAGAVAADLPNVFDEDYSLK